MTKVCQITDFLDTVIQTDSLELLPRLPSESVDLVFADPPYNLGKNYGTTSDRRSDYREWCTRWITECFRILKPTGSFYLMTLTRHLDWKLPLMAQHGVFINLVCWRNVSASHSKRSFWNEYQPIMCYGKTADYKFNTYAETEETGLRRWGGYSTEYKGQLKDHWIDIPFVYAGSIQHPEAILEPGTKRKLNPTQSPVRLIRRCIIFNTDPGDIVLDPFGGVGTTAIAAIREDRHFLCVEIEEKYYRAAQERIEMELAQPRFDFCKQEEIDYGMIQKE